MNDIEYTNPEEKYTWTPVAYMLSLFIVVLFAAPYFLGKILIEDKWGIVAKESTEILIYHFNFKKLD